MTTSYSYLDPEQFKMMVKLANYFNQTGKEDAFFVSACRMYEIEKEAVKQYALNLKNIPKGGLTPTE